MALKSVVMQRKQCASTVWWRAFYADPGIGKTSSPTPRKIQSCLTLMQVHIAQR